MPNTNIRKNALKRLAPAIENAAVVLSEESGVQVVSQSVARTVVSQSVARSVVSQSVDGGGPPPSLAKVVAQSIDNVTP